MVRISGWPRWPGRALLVVGLAVTSLLSWRVVAVSGAAIGPDAAVDARVGGPVLGTTVVLRAARLLSWLGLAGLVVAITVALVGWLYWRAERRLAGWLPAVVVTGWLCTWALKLAVDRHRPPTNGEFWHGTGPSFPSGHASVGVYAFGAFAVVLVAVGPERWRRAGAIVVSLIGVLIGVSRVVLGVHWTTDVLAGWALGAAVLGGGLVLLPWWVGAARLSPARSVRSPEA